MLTWVTVFILFNVQQWQIDIKVRGDVEIIHNQHMSFKRRPYWGHFTKVIESLVTLLVSNVLEIRCVHYVGQK